MKPSIDLTGNIIVKADDKKPYGDVKYADPSEGKYPIDTEEHIRAAWNYINKPHNQQILGDKASSTRSAIISAWKKKIDPAGPASVQKGGPGSGPQGGKHPPGTRVTMVRPNNTSAIGLKGKTGTVISRLGDGHRVHWDGESEPRIMFSGEIKKA